MNKLISQNIVFLFFVLIFTSISFSQENKKHQLVEIEDSLREKLYWKYDSTWVNAQLNYKKSISTDTNFYTYKLVKIGQRSFTEGPHSKIFYQADSNNFAPTEYGDSSIILLGQKVYTYIGNSSWGYHQTYHLIRKDILERNRVRKTIDIGCEHGVYPNSSIPCLLCQTIKQDSVIKIDVLKTQHLCEHGWDQLRGQACPQCLHQYRMIKDSIIKIRPTHIT